jgi:hypothetical protein
MADGPFFVTFKLGQQPIRVPTPDHERWTLDDIKDGFWLTKNRVLCRERQGFYWIPPASITLVEKRE